MSGNNNKTTIVIGVDVGSGSVRVSLIKFVDGVIDSRPLATHKKSITVHNTNTHIYEQNTDEIWSALCECVQNCMKTANINYKQITGISFSATCSLAIIDKNKTGNDVIMWMDHRAINEAKYITETKNAVLEQMGGNCSPEFSLAKLLWTKRHQRQRFDEAVGFMELPDWLAWKCSNFEATEYPRSVCSVVCKWGYDAVNRRWRDDLLQLIGLEEFVKDKSKIGAKIVLPGTHIGYVSKKVAKDFGFISNLNEINDECIDISIASPLIDAHAGALSMCMFSHELKEVSNEQLDYDNLFCMIAGTSTCDFISTHKRYFTEGVWGPYYDAIFPNYYVREAGQSTTGILLEHVIKNHQDYHQKLTDKPINDIIKDLNKQILGKPYKTKLNVNPCFHGSRLLANPYMKGGYYGLTMDGNNIVDWYHAAVEALAYESKYILDELKIPDLKKVLISGGLAKNDVYMQLHADVLNIDVITFDLGDADLMLVGAAILAYHSIFKQDLNTKLVSYPDLDATYFRPTPELQDYHKLKYKCFREMLESATRIEEIMKDIHI
ncbi:FGGY carbohydrate kinase domain-containing protein-like [Oppia nitens]|uniref:FGGY carbohydrate kinase domain-containing protein-like n=1 Tax=Oppia nitens TaxID=1686743 RepID=UPI0023DC36C1|nr:FGGY carbohydrate kinase domain-containing protein-like [Oppia nitens]XP_054161610.1 FGGY carbohydrate kinase domain-containing protein-like [Oppia nitens]